MPPNKVVASHVGSRCVGVNTVLYKMLSLVQEMRSELNTTQFHTMFPTAAQLLRVVVRQKSSNSG